MGKRLSLTKKRDCGTIRRGNPRNDNISGGGGILTREGVLEKTAAWKDPKKRESARLLERKIHSANGRTWYNWGMEKKVYGSSEKARQFWLIGGVAEPGLFKWTGSRMGGDALSKAIWGGRENGEGYSNIEAKGGHPAMLEQARKQQNRGGKKGGLERNKRHGRGGGGNHMRSV